MQPDQLILELAAPPAPTLENFVAGRNRELVDVLLQLIERRSQERFVYLWGAEGCGRTHLLHAVVNEFERNRRSAVYMVAGAEPEPIHKACAAQLLAVDDVDRLSPQGQIHLFNEFNRRREADGLLLVSGPLPATRLGLRKDLVTRLSWGLVYRVHELSDEEKALALESRARDLGFELPRDATSYLLHHGRRDLPSLIALLEAVDRVSLAAKRPVSVALLREILQRPGASSPQQA